MDALEIVFVCYLVVVLFFYLLREYCVRRKKRKIAKTLYMTLKVTDDILVDKIKNGDVNAISIGGYGKATKRLNFIERIFLFFDPKERKIRKMFKRKLKELNINSVALIEKQKESKNEN